MTKQKNVWTNFNKRPSLQEERLSAFQFCSKHKDPATFSQCQRAKKRGMPESERMRKLMESKEEHNDLMTLQHDFSEYATTLEAISVYIGLVLSNCHSKVVMIRKVAKLNLWTKNTQVLELRLNVLWLPNWDFMSYPVNSSKGTANFKLV